MSNSAFYWSTSSISLAIAVISITLVFSISLCPKERSTNDSERISGILSYIISSVFLAYETKIWFKLKIFGFIIWKLCLRISNHNSSLYEGYSFTGQWNHHFLAYCFFIGYALIQIWNIANEIYFAFDVPECFLWLTLLADTTKIILAMLLIVAIAFKDTSTKNSKLSWFGWSFVGAVCFGSAFKYIVEEVTWGYITIVEKSIADPEYGLNLSNYTSAEKYLDPIFKFKAKCIHHVIFARIAEPILELIPFSTEYFSLATFFCVVTWKNLDSKSEHHVVNENENEDTATQHHACNEECWFSLSKLTAVGIVIVLLIATIISVCAFYIKMESDEYSFAVWVFIWQQLIFQTIIVTLELAFYHRHLRHKKSTQSPPRQKNFLTVNDFEKYYKNG